MWLRSWATGSLLLRKFGSTMTLLAGGTGECKGRPLTCRSTQTRNSRRPRCRKLWRVPVTFSSQQLSMTTSRPVRSTQPSPQACRVAVEDRSEGFAHTTKVRVPTTTFARPKQRATNASARAPSAEQPRTPGAFANRASAALADSIALRSQLQAYFGQIRESNRPVALVQYA